MLLGLGSSNVHWGFPRRCVRRVVEVAGGAGWGADPVGAQREPCWDFGECGVCARHSGGLLPADGCVQTPECSELTVL